MIVLSLFDGISCAYEALVKAGIPITKYYASEVDKYAIEVSKKRHPNIIQLGDVKGVKGFPVDLLIGGSPCQDLSVAKKGRQGLDGDRSSLFFEYVRLLDECKPKYFVLENVASMSNDSRNVISLVMGIEPIMIDASLVSAQSRKRYFWTNIPVDIPEDKGIMLKDILLKDVEDKYYIKKEMTDVSGNRMVGLIGGNSQANRVYSTDGKSVTLSANGGGLGAKTGLYKIGRDIGRRLDDNGTRKDDDKTIAIQRRIEVRDDDKCGTLTSVMKDNLVVGMSIRAHHDGEKWVDKLETRKDEKVSALTQSFQGKLALVGNQTMIRRLTPVECERLQGLCDGYTEGISDNQRYKCLGNAFNVDVVSHILSKISIC